MDKGEKNGVGRPTKYDPKYNEQAYKLCLLGATDKDLADFFNVDEVTVNNWKKEYPGFFDSLRNGKQIADSIVAEKLYHRAIGYEHTETITASFQGKITDTMEVVKRYPPDTTAALKWLTNRQPEKWRDKTDIEHTGPKGGPLLMQDITSLSDGDLKKLLEIMERSQIKEEIVDIVQSE